MNSFSEKCKKTQDFLLKRMPYIPEVAVILGSGLSGVGEDIPDSTVIPYSEIPNMMGTKVKTHSGNMVLAEFAGKKVVFFQGRIHAYEGYDMLDIAFFPLTASLAGAKILITTNLTGGIRKDLKPGDLVMITDHINLSGLNPLIALGKAEGKPLFVDMYDAYSLELRELLKKAGCESGIELKEGRLAFFPGPNFETQMELEFLQKTGADIVGWSLVPEVLVAKRCGMKVAGISCVSDISNPECFLSVDASDIFEQGIKKAGSLKRLMSVFLPLIDS